VRRPVPAPTATALAVALLCALAPAPGACQPDAPAAGETEVTLGLREAAELAVLGADSTGPEIADWKVKEERARLWPSLSVRGQVSSESLDTSSTTTQSQFGISGTIERYGADAVVSTNLLQFLETRPRIDAARAEQRAARLRLTDEQNDRVLRAVDAYLSLASAQEALAIFGALRSEQSAFAARQQEKFANDAIPMIELIRARSEILSLDREYLGVRQRAASAELTLRKLTGLKPQQRLRLAAAPDPLDLAFIDAEGLPGLLALARDGNPRLLAANATVEKARGEVMATKSLKYPSLSLNGSVGYGHVHESTDGGGQRTGPRHSVYLTLGVPVFDGGIRDAQIAQAELRVESRLRESRQAAEEIRAQVEELYRAFREREEAVELLARQVVLAEDELHQANARANGGVAPGNESMWVLSKLARLRSDLSRARSELEIRGTALALAVGRNPFRAPGSSLAPERAAQTSAGAGAAEPRPAERQLSAPAPRPVDHHPPWATEPAPAAPPPLRPPVAPAPAMVVHLPPPLPPPDAGVAPAATALQLVASFPTAAPAQETAARAIAVAAPPLAPVREARRLKGIDVVDGRPSTTVSVRADGRIARYSAFPLPNPSRFVIDVEGLESVGPEFGGAALARSTPDVSRVRIGRYPGRLRIVLDLARDSLRPPRIAERADGLEITIGDGE
jgi:outer membrane protein TolC